MSDEQTIEPDETATAADVLGVDPFDKPDPGADPDVVAKVDELEAQAKADAEAADGGQAEPETPDEVEERPAFTLVTPQPVYTRDEGDLAIPAIAGQQWIRSPYVTDAPSSRPLFYFAHDTLGEAEAHGDGSGGIWHLYTGPVRVDEPVG